MKISVKFDPGRIIRRMNDISEKVVPYAMASAINRTLEKAKTQVKRSIIGQTGLPQKTFAKNFKVFPAWPKRYRGKLWVGLKFGRSLSKLTSAQQKKVLNKHGILSLPFTATMKSGHTGRYVRVRDTGTNRASLGWSRGRPRTSSRNLPLLEPDKAVARLPAQFTASEMRAVSRNFINRELGRLLHDELVRRLRNQKITVLPWQGASIEVQD